VKVGKKVSFAKFALLFLLLILVERSMMPQAVKVSNPSVKAPDSISQITPTMYIPQHVDENGNKIEDVLEEEIQQKVAEGNGSQFVKVVVLLNAPVSSVHNSIFTGFNGTLDNGPWKDALYGFGGKMPYVLIAKFAGKCPDLLLVQKDHECKAFMAYAARQGRARPYVWDTLGFRGDPASSIAISDTGIDDSHPNHGGFGDADFSRKIVGWRDDVGTGTTPYDDNGHGSHCAGVSAGEGFFSTDVDGRAVATWSAASLSGLPGDYIVTGFNVTRTGTVTLEVSASGGTTVRLWYADYSGDTGIWVEVASGSVPRRGGSTTVSYSVDEAHVGYYHVTVRLSLSAIDVVIVIHWPFDAPDDGYEAWTGVAPQARLVGLKGLDSSGTGYSSDLVAGIDWAVANREKYHILALSMSWGGTGYSADIDNAVTNAVNSGIVCVAAAGNDGSGGNYIHSPGSNPYVISVAATSCSDNITSYSSQGGPSEAVSSVMKPDISAPGGSFFLLPIFSTDSNDQDAESTYSDRFLNDSAPMQGTSMSAPFIAGCADVVAQALGGYVNWNYTSNSMALLVKTLLLMTATETFPLLRERGTASSSPSLDRGGKDVHEGFGRVNLDAAVEAVTLAYTIGSIGTGFLGSSPLERKCWARSVYLSANNVYEFDLTVPSGADFDLYLYNLTGNGFGEPVIVANSTGAVTGNLESITYTPSLSGKYYLVVKRASEDAGSGQFTLTSTSAPAGERYLLYAEQTARIAQRKAWDWQFGGYYNELNREWSEVNNDDKSILGNTFYIHGLIYLYDRTKNSTYLAWARNATDYILSKAWDSTNGGVYDLYDRSWNRKTNVKTLQEQADFLYVLVDLYQRTGNITYYDYANRTADFILAHYHDDVYGGIYRSYNQTSGAPNYNKHTEIGLGAFGWGMTHWYELTKNETALNWTRETNDFIWNHLYDPVYGGLMTEVNRSGESIINDYKYPNIEFWGVFGMLGYYRHTGNLTVKGWIMEVLDHIYDKMWDKTYGGWYRSLYRDNTVRLETKDGWCQSEQPWFWWLAYKTFNNETYKEIALLSLEWTADNNYDTEYGGFYLELYRDGTIKWDMKNDWVEGGGISAFALVAPRHDVYLLLIVEPTQTTYSVGDTITFRVHVFNQNNPALDSTLTLAVTGPGEYYYFDFQRISVAADAIAEYTFSWEIPAYAVTATYRVEVELVPPQLTAYDAVWLEVV